MLSLKKKKKGILTFNNLKKKILKRLICKLETYWNDTRTYINRNSKISIYREKKKNYQ